MVFCMIFHIFGAHNEGWWSHFLKVFFSYLKKKLLNMLGFKCGGADFLWRFQTLALETVFWALTISLLQPLTVKKSAKSPFVVILPPNFTGIFCTYIVIDFRTDRIFWVYFRCFWPDLRNLVDQRGKNGILILCKEYARGQETKYSM